jgi:hypothetical protein
LAEDPPTHGACAFSSGLNIGTSSFERINSELGSPALPRALKLRLIFKLARRRDTAILRPTNVQVEATNSPHTHALTVLSRKADGKKRAVLERHTVCGGGDLAVPARDLAYPLPSAALAKPI